MQLRSSSPEHSAKEHFYLDFATFIYTSIFFHYIYSNLFLTIGSLDNLYLFSVFFFLEFLKYFHCTRRCKAHSLSHVFKELPKKIFLVFVTFDIIYILAVLFGAPFLSSVEETTMFSSMLTLFTVVPLTFYYGAEHIVNLFFSLTSFEGDGLSSVFMLKLRLTLFSAWLGALVIPLDWNRPWQTWPIPCCMSAILGFALSHLISALYLLRLGESTFKKNKKYHL